MNGCFLCKDEKEVIGHILLHDAKIRILWQTVYSVWYRVDVAFVSLRDSFKLA